MPHHRGCTHLQRTGHERQSEAAGNFRLAIYLLLHTGRHRRLLLRQPVAQYRIHLAVRYREVLRRPAATHPQPGKPRCPGRSGETRENARRIQGTPALELHYGTGQRRRLQHGLRGRPCHRPHQRSRSPAGEKDSPNSRRHLPSRRKRQPGEARTHLRPIVLRKDNFQQAAQRAVDDQRPAPLSHLAGQLLRRP